MLSPLQPPHRQDPAPVTAMQHALGFRGHTEISPKRKLNSQSSNIREMCTAEPLAQEKNAIFFFMHSASSYKKQQRGTCLNVTPSLPYFYRRLLTPRLPAVCWASQAQLKFLAFIFLHCPCLPHRLPSPARSRRSRTARDRKSVV